MRLCVPPYPQAAASALRVLSLRHEVFCESARAHSCRCHSAQARKPTAQRWQLERLSCCTWSCNQLSNTFDATLLQRTGYSLYRSYSCTSVARV